MTRYYYTCPIKAAYMAEYFGLEMSYLFCDADCWQEYKSTERMGAFEIDKYFNEDRATLDGRIWVSDEWNDFFKHKWGDILHYEFMGGSATHLVPQVPNIHWSKDCRNMQIIFRDNKAFFMPEVEND